MPDCQYCEQVEEPAPAPDLCIVCVEPEIISWWTAICRRIPHLKFLSDGITWADNGRYSHNALKHGGEAMDVRLGDGASIWEYAALAGLRRELGFYKYCGDPSDEENHGCARSDAALANVWDTIQAEAELPDPLPGPDDTPIGADGPDFTIFGLLRLGVILLQDGRRLGRWLTNRRKDDPGFFCSELIAKGFAETDTVDLWVDVESDRIPEQGTGEWEATVDAMVARSAPFGEEPAAGTADERRALFNGQLAALADVPPVADGTTTMRIKVGYIDDGDEECLFPPVLVTPNDLARSPSLEFVGSKCGCIRPGEHGQIDAELRRRRGRDTRMILWGLPIVLVVAAAAMYLVASGRTPLQAIRYVQWPAIGLLAVVGGYAIVCWRTEPPAPPSD